MSVSAPSSRQSPSAAVKLSAREEAALRAMAARYSPGDERFLYFRTIQAEAALPVGTVRRTVRALARKGLAVYQRGLFNEDGETAGSGYGCTPDGAAWVAARASK